jgi:ribosome maturation protein Sdo1
MDVAEIWQRCYIIVQTVPTEIYRAVADIFRQFLQRYCRAVGQIVHTFYREVLIHIAEILQGGYIQISESYRRDIAEIMQRYFSQLLHRQCRDIAEIF